MNLVVASMDFQGICLRCHLVSWPSHCFTMNAAKVWNRSCFPKVLPWKQVGMGTNLKRVVRFGATHKLNPKLNWPKWAPSKPNQSGKFDFPFPVAVAYHSQEKGGGEGPPWKGFLCYISPNCGLLRPGERGWLPGKWLPLPLFSGHGSPLQGGRGNQRVGPSLSC